MTRRTQEAGSLRTIYNADDSRRVCLVKNLDGTFGFLEWTYYESEGGYWGPTRIGAGSRCASLEEALREAKGRVKWLVAEMSQAPCYQLGWTTLPGLRGLSVSEFRATPTDAPDNERGVAVEFASEAARDEFLQAAEAEFASRRFTNTADAFDTVKAWALARSAK